MEMVELGQIQPKIAPKRMKFQEIEDDREEDRITALPDCLLLEILSRLPSTKDAIKTGTLSKRWKHLWTLVPTLIFNYYDHNHLLPDIIDKTLTQCRQLKLKRFEVNIYCDIQFEPQVKSLIRFAVIRNVEELSLKFSIESEVELENYFFISSCFTDLTLECCILNPTGTISWNNLRSLSMSFVKLDEDLIENILSGSPLLETLILGRCYGYGLLDITSKSVKELVFDGYDDPEDEYDERANIIEINAPNILSLTIRGNLLLGKLSLLNVSSVVEADIDYEHWWHWETIEKDEEDEILKGFIVNLRHVKELKIGSLCSKALSRLEAKGFDSPSNLTFPGVNSD